VTEPDQLDMVVEIPRGSRNKYEFDEERGVMRLDRRIVGAVAYPADYGFVPGTVGEDGEPLDALVLLDEPTYPGCPGRSRPRRPGARGWETRSCPRRSRPAG